MTRTVLRLGAAAGSGGAFLEVHEIPPGLAACDGGADEVGDLFGVRQHDQVGGLDLDGGHSGALVAEALDVGVDGVIVDRDRGPGGLGLPGRGGGLLGEGDPGQRALPDGEDPGQVGVDVCGEDGRELREVDVDVGAGLESSTG